MSERRRIPGLVLLVALVLAGAGCVPDSAPIPPDPTSQPRAFTVGTTDQITVSDPAAITDAASATVAYNVFQRLMSTSPVDAAPKPDAADCKWESPTRLLCTLVEGLTFHNGHELTSSDVKFSFERALRLNVPGSSASAMSSLRRIEAPDPLTVRFILSQADSQFWHVLATPAASIVDEEVYDPDEVRPVGESMVGSGPFQVSFFDSEELQLARFDRFEGRQGAGVSGLVLRMYPSSTELEEAMADHEVDVVWRGLTAAAVARLQLQLSTNGTLTEDGFAQVQIPGARVRQLWWNPDSDHRKDEDMRAAVAGALQDDRVMASLVPSAIAGSRSTFDVGPGAEIETPWKERAQLTLAYDPTAPDAIDQANQIRTRLEERASMSVKLVTATPVETADADLRLVDFKAWTPTGMAWLQPYLEQPIQEDEVEELVTRIRESVDPDEIATTIGELQELAAEDLVVLPIIQTDEFVFVADGWLVDQNLLAPGWQLGMWGFRRA